jgi:hypothetical protein
MGAVMAALSLNFFFEFYTMHLLLFRGILNFPPTYTVI